MSTPTALLVPLLAAALAGCGILVDRYDSASPRFTAEYENETARAVVAEQAEEYCGVFGRTATLRTTQIVDGDPVAVFDCR